MWLWEQQCWNNGVGATTLDRSADVDINALLHAEKSIENKLHTTSTATFVARNLARYWRHSNNGFILHFQRFSLHSWTALNNIRAVSDVCSFRGPFAAEMCPGKTQMGNDPIAAKRTSRVLKKKIKILIFRWLSLHWVFRCWENLSDFWDDGSFVVFSRTHF